MANRSREKIALVIFAVVVVLGLIVAGAYIAASHSLNVAATHIDDAVGSMDDYTVFVYQGTLDREAADASQPDDAEEDGSAVAEGATAEDPADKGGSSTDDAAAADPGFASTSDAVHADAVGEAAADQRAEGSISSTPGASAARGADGLSATSTLEATEGAEGSSSSASGVSAANGSDGLSAASASDANEGLSESARGAAADASQDGSDSRLSEFLDSLLSSGASVPDPPAPIEPVSVDDVAADYRDKGASVVVLPTDDLSRYATGRIVGSGNRRIGVFSIPEGSSVSDVRDTVAYFQLHDVDFVVAIASTAAPARLVEGIDVLVTTERANASALGETLEGTYLVQAPETDSVGVVMVAPSLVVSTKVVAP